jgi:Protein of unknown function (DUF1592)/Protein of unknown function (DUF1588)/Protein of unknown function (DUF1595)/Protein of unknown function (DUF1587)/Protein of unknown function (DUF1585)
MQTHLTLRRAASSCGLVLALVGSSLLACDGFGGDSEDTLGGWTPPGIPTAEPSSMPFTDAELNSSRFVRLTHTQWENTIRDLFGAASGLTGSFAADAPSAFDTGAHVLLVAPNLWQDYQGAAETLAERAVASDQARQAWFPADLPADPAQAARAFVERVGLRVFRRPLTPDEVGTYVALFNRGAELTTWTISIYAGARITLQAMLQAPQFLYRMELGAAGAPLNAYERAAKLSYALWNTMPDDALFAAAAKQELDSAAMVDVQVRRMLADPRARQVVARFHEQQYGLREIENLEPAVPGLGASYGASAAEELRRFVDSIAVGEPRGLKDLLTSREAFVNQELASAYGISGTFAGFQKVSLPASERSGLLTRVGFSALYSAANLPSAIHRGTFVNRKILCSNLPNPPQDVPPLAELTPNTTSRQRVEAHTGKGTCGGSCHTTFINPAGFALEHYDAAGRFRTKEGSLPVNSADTIQLNSGATVSFSDAVDFSTKMANEPQVHDCYARTWLHYLYGRPATPIDDKPLAETTAASLGGSKITDIVVRLVTNPNFLTHFEVKQ